MSENMRIYAAFEKTPPEAQTTILGGRLKGMTDINPMHRIKALTECFGPCGLGWYTEITRQAVQDGPNGELMCFIDLNLYYRENCKGEWSKPVFGTGGNTCISKETKGLYANDEGWKMAYTDALSVACKALGMCADVYFKKDYSKYTQPRNEEDLNKISNARSSQQPAKKDEKPAAQPPQQPAKKDEKPSAPPASQQPATRMAVAGQKQFIIDNATDEQYQAAMEAYGTELERMPYAHAAKLIAKIQKGMNGNGN